MKDKLNQLILSYKRVFVNKISAYLTRTLIKIRRRLIYLESARQIHREKNNKTNQFLDRYYDKKIGKLNKKRTKYLDSLQKYDAKLNHIIDLEHKCYQSQILTTIGKLEMPNQSDKKKKKYQNKINDLELEIRLIKDRIEVIKNGEDHLSISHLTMKFGGLKAVNDLSFSVKRGEIFGLIGPNGAGKTTVFNCITQFYRANSGAIYFNDRFDKLQRLRNFRTTDIVGLGIARTFQNVELIWELSVIDNLLVGAHSILDTSSLDSLIHTPKQRRQEKQLRQRAINILTTVGIEQYQFSYPIGLPYGILKKIELARSLITDPTLIILDEPAAGLNDQETVELSQLIKKINRDLKVTIFLVEHDMNLVMSTCDRVCAISFGQKLALGSPSEIKNNKTVQEAYLGGDDNGQ